MEQAQQDFLRLGLQAILENTEDMIFVKDRELRYQVASSSFALMVGQEDYRDLLGRTDFDLFSAPLAQKYRRDDQALLKSEEAKIEYVEALPGKGGKKRYSWTSKFLVRDAAGAVIGLCGIARDITAQIELEEEQLRLTLSNQMFDDVMEVDLTENQVLRTEGSRWGNAFDITPGLSFSKAVALLAEGFVHPDYKQEFYELYANARLRAAFEKGEMEFSHISYLLVDGQNYRWLQLSSRLYYSQITKSLRLMIFLKDIDAETKSRHALEKDAQTDALTGLYNRQTTVDLIEACLAEVGSRGKLRHALLFLDLDRFKLVNDTLGHPYGDKILREIGRRLQDQFRSDDVVGRVGGDEFLVLMKNVVSREAVERKLQELVQYCSYICDTTTPPIHVTCSVGVALYEGDGKSFSELYALADEAMYRAKAQGRSRAAF